MSGRVHSASQSFPLRFEEQSLEAGTNEGEGTMVAPWTFTRGHTRACGRCRYRSRARWDASAKAPVIRRHLATC